MPLVGVRELREHTAEVLRRVREEKAEYVITHQGRPIALLLPLASEEVEAAMIQAGKRTAVNGWETYTRLAEALRQAWPAEQPTRTLLDSIRRE
jgi:prevent-host-death family protein